MKRESEALLAAKTLLLHPDDYTVTFYQAVEFFENDDHNSALPLFLIAAENHCLHALPYLTHIATKSAASVKMDAEMRARINSINEWSKYLANIEVDHKEFFRISCEIIALRKLAKKESAKKKSTQYDRQVKAFIKKKNVCAHAAFHQALFNKKAKKDDEYYAQLKVAAKGCHLIAVAECIRLKQEDASEYFQKITQLDYHSKSQSFNFAERIFDIAVSTANLFRKYEFHFEAVRLGVAQAYQLIADNYFIQDKKIDQAFGLLTLGVRLDDADSRVCLAKLVSTNTKVRTCDYDVSPLAIINMLLLNINKQYRVKHFNYLKKFDYAADVEKATRESFYHWISKSKENRDIYNHDALIAALEQGFLQEEDTTLKFDSAACGHLLTSRKAMAVNDKKTKLHLQRQTVAYLKYTTLTMNKLDTFVDIFIIACDYHSLYAELYPDDKAKQLELTLELIGYIEKIEIFLAENKSDLEWYNHNYIKIIEECLAVYTAITSQNLPQQTIYEAQMAKYLRLCAQSTKKSSYQILIARYHLTGNLGFERDLTKARTILESLDESVLSQLETIRLIEITYIEDATADYQNFFALKLKYADRYPEFYFDFAEAYCDGSAHIKPNRELARKYYYLAIDKGHAEANVGLSIMLLEDLEGQPDNNELKTEIMRRFLYAFDANSGDAAYFIGREYMRGNIVAYDLEQAKHYFNIAVQRSDHKYAKTLLKMMEYGYQGDNNLNFDMKIVQLYYLKKYGYIDTSSFGMFDYGLIYLQFDAEEGMRYLHKSAKYNFLSAQFLIAAFQTLVDFKLHNFSDEVAALVNSADYRYLSEDDLQNHMHKTVRCFFQFTNIVRGFAEKNYPISKEYIPEMLLKLLVIDEFDPQTIAAEIRQRFPTEEILKTRLLANRLFTQLKSGDTECAQLTDDLLSQKKTKAQALTQKFSQHKNNDVISMNHLDNCLKAFLSSGVTAEKRDLKSIKAAIKMHRPHGRGDYNAHQDLEGGRKETAAEALDIMTKLTSISK